LGNAATSLHFRLGNTSTMDTIDNDPLSGAQEAAPPPLTVPEAQAVFARLTRAYGLRWTPSVPRSAWDELNRCNEVLTEDDRRAAIGLPAYRGR